jgi:hypothetical protein
VAVKLDGEKERGREKREAKGNLARVVSTDRPIGRERERERDFLCVSLSLCLRNRIEKRVSGTLRVSPTNPRPRLICCVIGREKGEMDIEMNFQEFGSAGEEEGGFGWEHITKKRKRVSKSPPLPLKPTRDEDGEERGKGEERGNAMSSATKEAATAASEREKLIQNIVDGRNRLSHVEKLLNPRKNVGLLLKQQVSLSLSLALAL